MSAVIIISIFLLVATSFAVFRSKRSSSNEVTTELPPGYLRGLFAEDNDAVACGGPQRDGAGAKFFEVQSQLRERAARGEFEVLEDAFATRDLPLYREILNMLVEASAATPERLSSLAAFILKSKELRAEARLANRVLEDWKQSPMRARISEVLRIAALSDDAAAYRRAVSTIFEFWREGRLPDCPAEELRALFAGEHWLLSSDAKRSGAGFVLKEELAEIRRQLEIPTRRESTTPTEAD